MDRIGCGSDQRATRRLAVLARRPVEAGRLIPAHLHRLDNEVGRFVVTAAIHPTFDVVQGVISNPACEMAQLKRCSGPVLLIDEVAVLLRVLRSLQPFSWRRASS